MYIYIYIHMCFHTLALRRDWQGFIHQLNRRMVKYPRHRHVRGMNGDAEVHLHIYFTNSTVMPLCIWIGDRFYEYVLAPCSDLFLYS